MSQILEAIYENGVFKPLEKVDLKDHQKIEIFIKEKESAAKKSQGILKGDPKVIEEIALSPEYSCMEE